MSLVQSQPAAARQPMPHGSQRAFRQRVCVVTSGHLSTCPRMLKAADALDEAGYQVRVVSARSTDWAWQADAEVRQTRRWEWRVVSYDHAASRARWLWSGLRMKGAKLAARVAGAGNCPLSLAARAYGRVHPELVAAILEQPADLIYGGASGALAAAACAARRAGVPYALDLEDFHTADQPASTEGALIHALAGRIERQVLHQAAFLTAGSSAIADAYREQYGLRPTPINNTFGLPARQPDFRSSGPLRLYWFSQTVGPGRGLEVAVRAAGVAGIPAELHLRGIAMPGYVESLERLARDTAPELKIIVHAPLPPDQMVDACRPYDVGLALEQPAIFNRAICLTNKIFTYMLAGLAVAATDTPGQRPLALDLGHGTVLFAAEDFQTLATALRTWHEQRETLADAKVAAWKRAVGRWHWDHPLEKGALLERVEQALVKR